MKTKTETETSKTNKNLHKRRLLKRSSLNACRDALPNKLSTRIKIEFKQRITTTKNISKISSKGKIQK